MADITSELVIAGFGAAGTMIAAAVASRSSRAVTKIPVEAEAYSRARRIDEAANARLSHEVAHLRTTLDEERAEWAAERSRLRAEINELETKLRELLDEVISFRSRSGLDEEDSP